MANIFDIADECFLLVPGKIAKKILKFAFTLKSLHGAKQDKNEILIKELNEKAGNDIAELIVMMRSDLGLNNLNQLLLNRVKR